MSKGVILKIKVIKCNSPTSADFTNALFLCDSFLRFLRATSRPGLVDNHGLLDCGPVVSHCSPIVDDLFIVDGADSGILPRGVRDSTVHHVVFSNNVFGRLDIAL